MWIWRWEAKALSGLALLTAFTLDFSKLASSPITSTNPAILSLSVGLVVLKC